MILRLHRSLGMCLVLGASAFAASDARLVDAAKRADPAAVQSLLKNGVDVNSVLADGTTALHWAAEIDDARLADLLISAGANEIGRAHV